jgi:hypothetical protein
MMEAMTFLRTLALVAVLTGCILQPRPAQPPADPRERTRAEAAACSRGTLPVWLDETAMRAAIELDRRESQASTANESFRGATFSAQPPATARPESRVAALLDERRAFQHWCASLRSGGSDLARPPGSDSPHRSR